MPRFTLTTVDDTGRRVESGYADWEAAVQFAVARILDGTARSFCLMGGDRKPLVFISRQRLHEIRQELGG